MTEKYLIQVEASDCKSNYKIEIDEEEYYNDFFEYDESWNGFKRKRKQGETPRWPKKKAVSP